MRITENYDSFGEIVYLSNQSGWNTLEDSEGKLVIEKSFNSPNPYISGGKHSVSMHIIIAYPREAGDNNGTEYNNEAIFEITGSHEQVTEVDLNDYVKGSDNVVVKWKDYNFSYNGSLTHLYKYLRFYEGTLDHLLHGLDITMDVNFDFTVTGYNYDDGYKAEVFDDAIYWGFSSLSDITTRMTEDDYEIIGDNSGNIEIDFEGVNVNKTNGEEFSMEMPEEGFTLMGQKGINGEWIYVTTVYEKNNEVPGSLFENKGFTGIKIVSPDVTYGKWDIDVSCGFKIFSSSAKFHEMYAQRGSYEKLEIINFVGDKFYQLNADGTNTWVNQHEESKTLPYQKSTGLNNVDLAVHGDYVHRDDATAKVEAVTINSDSGKQQLSIKNDTAHQKIDVAYCLEMYNCLSRALPGELTRDLEIQEGIFYDLLPPGLKLNNSEIIYARGTGEQEDMNDNTDNVVAAEVISVETIDNYKNTGRQLIKFHVKALEENIATRFLGNSIVSSYSGGQSTGFQLFFTASISWIEYRTFENDNVNLMAFQKTDGSQIVNAKPTQDEFEEYYIDRYITDNDEYEQVLDAFSDLNDDGNSDVDNTYYGYKPISLNVTTSSQVSITKLVKSDTGSYSNSAKTELGGDYSYYIAVGTDNSSEAKNIVLYDILEDAYEDKPGHWKGTFESIDTSVAEKMGIKPVYYYSTVTGLSDEDNTILTNGLSSDIWTTTCPDDKSLVTAVAIDLSYDTNGNDFVFKSNQSVYIEIFMKAPDLMPDHRLAYNKPAYTSTTRSVNSENWTNNDNIGTPVEIELVHNTDFTFKKYGEQGQIDSYDDEVIYAPLANVQFRIFDTTNKLLKVAYSDRDGNVTFTGLAPGTYYLKEFSSANDAYSVPTSDYAKYTFTIDEDLNISLPTGNYHTKELFKEAEDGSYYLNNVRKTKNITVTKYWKDTPNALQPAPLDVEYILYRNGVEFIRKKGQTTSFLNLYTHDENGKLYVYTIEEVPMEGFTTEINYTSYSNSYKVYNTMLGVLEISKVVEDNLNLSSETNFNFDINLSANSVNLSGEYTAIRIFGEQETREKVNFVDGKATVQLKKDEKIRIIGLPIDSIYTVVEEAQADYDTSYRTGTITGTAKDVLTNEKTDGNSASGTVDKGALNKVEFTNSIKTGSLSLSKLVDGNYPIDNDREFTFQVEFTNGVANSEANYTIDGVTFTSVSLNDQGEATITIKLKNNETVVFTNLSLDTTYSISEENSIVDGYVTTVSIDDEASTKTLTATDTVSKESSVVYTNTKNMSSVDTILNVNKVISQREPTDNPTFEFRLEAVTPNAPMPTNDIVTITTNTVGSESFEAITYTEAGLYQYKLSEVKEELWGYTYDETIYTINVNVTYDENGRLVTNTTSTTSTNSEEVNVSDSSLEFNNIFAAGKLSVSKKVTGAAADLSEPFEFRITLSGIAGSYDYHIKHHYGLTTDEKGTVVVEEGIETELLVDMVDGETLTFEQLPIGLNYTVKEKLSDDEEYDTSFTVENGSDEGNNIDDKTYSDHVILDDTVISYTNNRDHFPTKFTAYVEKAINGDNPITDRDFEFILTRISATDGSGDKIDIADIPMPDKLNTDTKSAKITGTGVGEFGEFIFDNDGTYYYTIHETVGTDWGYTYDSTVYHVYVKVSHEETDSSKLIVDVEFYTDENKTNKAESVKFSNTFDAGSLTVKKLVTGNAGVQDQPFNFDIKLTGNDGTYTYIKSDGTQGSLTIVNGTGTLSTQLKHNETITFNELPIDMEYEVVETDANENNYTTSYVNEVGNITDESIVTVTNHRDYPDTNFNIQASKLVSQETLYDKDFSFELSAITENAPMPNNNIVTITGAGIVDFGNITFSEIGTYQYRLVEKTGSDWGYTYDQTKHYIDVIVSDSGNNDGTLSITSKIHSNVDETLKDYVDENSIQFTNTYTYGSLKVSKMVTGLGDMVKDFMFTITFTGDYSVQAFNYTKTDYEGIQTVGSISAGANSFTLKHNENIVFEELPVGMNYEVSEENYTNLGYVTDSIDATGSIVVGTSNVKYTNNKIESTVDLKLEGKKNISGKAPEIASKFEFELSAKTNGAPMPNDSTESTLKIEVLGNDFFDFGTIEFTKPGTYVYQIKEIDNGNWGYTYDPSIYTITIEVFYNSTAVLESKVTRTKDYNGSITSLDEHDSIMFVNDFDAGSLHITKHVTGNAGELEKDFNFTIEFEGENGTYNYLRRYGAVEQFTVVDNKASVAVTLQDGEYVHFTQLPMGMKYKIVETEENQNRYTTSYVNQSGTITDDIIATTTNHRVYEPIQFDLQASKIISGDKPTSDANFTFKLDAITANAPMPENATVTINGSGVVDFGNIDYDEIGTYEYTLSEINNSLSGYIYDNTIYKLTVVVSDSGDANGVLSLEVSYTINDLLEENDYEDEQDLEFNNTYKAPVIIVPPVEEDSTPTAPSTGDDGYLSQLRWMSLASFSLLGVLVLTLYSRLTRKIS